MLALAIIQRLYLMTARIVVINNKVQVSNIEPPPPDATGAILAKVFER
jgi:hypothetical protein